MSEKSKLEELREWVVNGKSELSVNDRLEVIAKLDAIYLAPDKSKTVCPLCLDSGMMAQFDGPKVNCPNGCQPKDVEIETLREQVRVAKELLEGASGFIQKRIYHMGPATFDGHAWHEKVKQIDSVGVKS